MNYNEFKAQTPAKRHGNCVSITVINAIMPDRNFQYNAGTFKIYATEKRLYGELHISNRILCDHFGTKHGEPAKAIVYGKRTDSINDLVYLALIASGFSYVPQPFGTWFDEQLKEAAQAMGHQTIVVTYHNL